MGMKKFIVGVLQSNINPKNIKALSGFVSHRLGGKSIEMTVEAGGKQLKIKATNREELEAAMAAAMEFIKEEEQGPIVGEVPPWE